MMVNHSLVKILSEFAWTMLSMGGIMYIAHLAPFLIVFALTGLVYDKDMIYATSCSK